MIWAAFQLVAALLATGAGNPGAARDDIHAKTTDPVPFIVLGIAGMGQSADRAPAVARGIGNRLYASGLFRAPGKEAIWVDPHYGYLGRCFDQNCAWRATLLLDVRYAVVGSISGYGQELTLDLDAVDGETGEARKIVVHGPFDSLVPFAAQDLAGGILGAGLRRSFDGDSVSEAGARRVRSLVSRLQWADRTRTVFCWTGAALLLFALKRSQDPNERSATGIATAGFGLVGSAAILHLWKPYLSDDLHEAERQLGARLVSFTPTLGMQACGVRFDAAF